MTLPIPKLKKPIQPKVEASSHEPKILLLYGSLRELSYSRLAAEEAARILESIGAEVRIYNPENLPIKSPANENHPEVQSFLEIVQWSEGMVWSCPEIHGNLSGLFKNQIDWIPLSIGATRPTQGKTLAVMQVCGGSQSFNVVNSLRILGRWMRMLTIPNQSSIPKAYQEKFNEDGTMMDSALRNRIVDVMEELYKFTILTRDHKDFLTSRYSERREKSEKESKLNDVNTVDLASI